MTNLTIVGNALCGMIAALEIADQGQEVTVLNPGGPLGGYFAGVSSGGYTFDLGLVKFELDGYSSQQDVKELSTYDPELRNDVGRFLNLVREWALSYTPLNQLPMPTTYYGGKRYDDVILANAYHSFQYLPFAKQAAAELSGNIENPAWHAREKANGSAYATLDYETASVSNHGKTMHQEIIDPFVKKAMGVSADKVLARFHRVPWSPLYYRETLGDAFVGKLPALAPTQFHYPVNGSVSAIVTKVKEAMLAHPNITYRQSKVEAVSQTEEGWQLQLSDGEIQTKQLTWTHQPSLLLKATGMQPTPVNETKAMLGILLLRVDANAGKSLCSMMNLIDKEYATYRITNQSFCAESNDGGMNITIEFNTDYFRQLYGEMDDAQIAATLVNELVAIDMLQENPEVIHQEIKRIPGGFLVPNQLAKDAWENDRERIKSTFPSIQLLGMASGFFATSINDQVVQGLYYANKVKLLSQVDAVANNKEAAVCL